MAGTITGELFASWELPSAAAPDSITDYALQVSSDTGASWQSLEDGVSKSTWASLAGLDPAKSYVVRVAAVGTAGTGQWSAFSSSVSPRGSTSSTTVEFVHVGNPGNLGETQEYYSDAQMKSLTFGGVPYEYRIGKYEITIGQYAEFLNAIAKTDPYGLYDTNMSTDGRFAGIARSGSSGT